MTSLLPSRSASATSRDRADRGADRLIDRMSEHRPLALVAALGGLVAAGSTLLVCLGAGVVGWFLTDAGGHGSPAGGLRVGAHIWLLGHGSGVTLAGAVITAVPLGLTVLCGWVTWRVAHRVGDSIAGHGPDAEAIADGERDWTVPSAAALFAVGYLVVAILTVSLASTAASAPSTTRVVLGSLLLLLVTAVPALAIGSGRAAIWLPMVPPTVRASLLGTRHIVTTWLAAATVCVVAALIVDFDTAVNVMSQLHTNAGDVVVITVVSLLLMPNAIGFGSSYLLGPGFSVGAGTTVTPSVVVLGPLPLFPMLAALPDDGQTPGWTPWLVVLPVLIAALGAGWAARRLPTTRWDEGLIRGGIAGVVAGLVAGVLAAIAGGAVGPGRLRAVGPDAFDTLVHAVTAFGLGGLLGAAVMVAWHRHTHAEPYRADDEAELTKS